MIILDTNVLSEMMKADPDAAVRSWINEQDADTLFISSVTLAEIMFGIAALPAGKRRDRFNHMLGGLMALFRDRVLSFDVDAARCYAALAVKARARGRGFPTPDGYIAATAQSRGFTIASRDTAPFEAAGVHCIDPWKHKC